MHRAGALRWIGPVLASALASSCGPDDPGPPPRPAAPTFIAAGEYTAGFDLAVADMDGDEHLDLVVLGGAYDASLDFFTFVRVLPGEGDGAFGTGNAYPVPPDTRGVAVADLDGDGRLDVITANHASESFSVLLGQGDGTLGPTLTTRVEESRFRSVTVADVDGDSIPDLVLLPGLFAENLYSGVTVVLGVGGGTFLPPLTSRIDPGGYVTDSAVVTDLTGDGLPDLVLGNGATLASNGDGTFRQLSRIVTGQDPGFVRMGHLDRDAPADLVFGQQWGPIAVLLARRDGSFRSSGQLTVQGGTHGLAIADVNGDGVRDIVATGGGRGFAVFLGYGDGRFEAEIGYPLGSGQSEYVVAADFDEDGRTDVVAGSVTGTVLFLNTSD